MFKAKHIMKTTPICVRPEMPIYDALRLLANSNVTCVPVVDKDLKLVATFDENDALRLIYENEEQVGNCVSDFMKTDCISADAHSNLIDLCDTMMDQACRLIPILDNGVLQGVTNRSDLIRAILKIKHQELPD